MVSNTNTNDVIVIGGGLVGGAMAYGLRCQGLSVTVLDDADDSVRPSRGNFGLIWVQDKGSGKADYARWSYGSVRLWPQLHDAIKNETGIDVELMQPSGLHPCLTEVESNERARQVAWLQEQVNEPGYRAQVLSDLGPEVVDATYSPMDGHCNPLKLLRAVHSANHKRGMQLHSHTEVDKIAKQGDVFQVSAGLRRWQAPRIVIAAGHATQAPSDMVGMFAPVRPHKGQVFVPERVQPLLPHPINLHPPGRRRHGADRRFDGRSRLRRHGARAPVNAKIAACAMKCFPALAHTRIVRTRAVLCVMPLDGFPIYQESASHPGAYAVTCHSGVTLAAQHAFTLAPWVAWSERPTAINAFPTTRFIPETEVKPHGC